MIWITEKNTARLILASCVISFAVGLICLSKALLALAHAYTPAIIIAVAILYSVIYREARKQAQCMLKFQRGPQSIISKATTAVGAVLGNNSALLVALDCGPSIHRKPGNWRGNRQSGDVVHHCRVYQLLHQSIHLLLQVSILSAQYYKVVPGDLQKCWWQAFAAQDWRAKQVEGLPIIRF